MGLWAGCTGLWAGGAAGRELLAWDQRQGAVDCRHCAAGQQVSWGFMRSAQPLVAPTSLVEHASHLPPFLHLCLRGMRSASARVRPAGIPTALPCLAGGDSSWAGGETSKAPQLEK